MNDEQVCGGLRAAYISLSMKSSRFPAYGWAGLALILLAELLLFVGVGILAVFFTPVVWSGYILLIDGIIFKKKGDSYFATRWKEFLAMLPVSALFWLVFEGYNLLIKNWHYVGLPENLCIRVFGYVWSFATIWPAVLGTHELLLAFGIFKQAKVRPLNFSSHILTTFMVLGAVELAIPILFPTPWGGFLFGPGLSFFWIRSISGGDSLH